MGQKQLINFLGLTWSSGPRNLMETPRNPLSVSAYHCAAFPINSLGPQKPSTCPLALSVQLHILIKTCFFVIPLRRQLWMHRGKNLRMPVSDGTVRHCPPHENIDQLANYANIFFLGGVTMSHFLFDSASTFLWKYFLRPRCELFAWKNMGAFGNVSVRLDYFRHLALLVHFMKRIFNGHGPWSFLQIAIWELMSHHIDHQKNPFPPPMTEH